MIIVVCNLKGGAMKTTLSVLMAGELKRRKPKKKHRILLVEGEPQGSIKVWREQAIKYDVSDDIWPEVFYYEKPILHKPDQIPAVVDNYDYIIIDVPPHGAGIATSAFAIADLVLIPVRPSILDAQQALSTIELIEDVQKSNPHLKAAYVITQRAVGSVIGKDVRTLLQTPPYNKFPILEADACFRVQFSEVPGAGEMMHTYAPRTKAATEIKAITDEVIKNYG